MRRGYGRIGLGKIGVRVLVKYMLVVMGVICFPWLVTMVFTGEFKGKIYKVSEGD